MLPSSKTLAVAVGQFYFNVVILICPLMENGHENASWPTLAPLNKTIYDANHNRHVGNGSKIGQGENESAFKCTSEGI